MTRLRVLYLVAGHDLVATAGPTRNALSLARAWSDSADVTLAFRRVGDAPADMPFGIEEIDPAAPRPEGPDDAAIRGMRVRELYAYLGRVRSFLDTHIGEYDVLLEKSWLLSGFACRHAQARGVPGAVLENVVRVFGGGGFLARAKHELIQARVSRYLRKTSVIAETPQLKQALVGVLGLDPDGVHVVQLGVDHRLFRPTDRAEARRRARDPRRGARRAALRCLRRDTRSRAGAPRARVPAGLADPGAPRGRRSPARRIRGYRLACRPRRHHLPRASPARERAGLHRGLGPVPRALRPGRVPGGEVAYSTLKIPEAMACARPVASVPSGNVRRLIQHDDVLVFSFPTGPMSWAELFASPPSSGRARCHDGNRRLAKPCESSPGSTRRGDITRSATSCSEALLQRTPSHVSLATTCSSGCTW